MSERGQASFDVTAQKLAETIDEILLVERSRARRVELIRHHVKRALFFGFKAGVARVSTSSNRRYRIES